MTNNQKEKDESTMGSYRLKKEPIVPSEWERQKTHYYKHTETGETIHEETYYSRIDDLAVLREYLEGFGDDR